MDRYLLDLSKMAVKIYYKTFYKLLPRPDSSQIGRYTIGWIAADHLAHPIASFRLLQDAMAMRVSRIAEWINCNIADARCEMYQPQKQYDVVVFFKAMAEADQAEAQDVKGYGGKVIFDANVNYYEIDGDFGSYSNKTTVAQQQDAIRMTTLADLCIADSTAIADRARKLNHNTVCIPDNVNLECFKYVRRHSPVSPVRLVWSGISFKADHLLLLKDVFTEITGAELILVSERQPAVIDALKKVIRCRYLPYSDVGYARVLGQCDIIISPKMLSNSYEIGHTEYKISLGMAGGLPVVASPQQSYIEAIEYKGGGIIAETQAEWKKALQLLIGDHHLRAELGRKARETIVDRYATDVIAQQYHQVVMKCLHL